jgi:hypothetical protein
VRRSNNDGATWGPAAMLSTSIGNWSGGLFRGPSSAALSDGFIMCFAWPDARNGDADVYARTVIRRVDVPAQGAFTASGAPHDVIHASRQLHNQDDLFPFELQMVAQAQRNWSLPFVQATLPEGQTAPLTYDFSVPDTAAPGPVNVTISYQSALPPYTTYASAVLQLTVLPAAGVPGSAARLELAPVAPSPARGVARFSYSLAAPGPVRLSIHAVDGRRVRELASAVESQGTHPVSWDGTDQGGAPVAAGAYFVRMEAGGRALSRRFVWLR